MITSILKISSSGAGSSETSFQYSRFNVREFANPDSIAHYQFWTVWAPSIRFFNAAGIIQQGLTLRTSLSVSPQL
jgi:hypothetical protein